MARATRAAVIPEKPVEQEPDNDDTTMVTPLDTYNIPQRSSRASSLANVEAPTPITNTQDGDAHMQNGDDSTDATEGGDAMQSFGHHSRQLIKVIQKLESLGIDITLTSLPKFVVVGDQSHGKSSIIEAICGISLPRSAGTCTRCPFRITTTATNPGGDAAVAWSCQISLARKWNYDRHRKDFTRTEAPAVPFAKVTNKEDLEDILRRAQIAVLNPSLEPHQVLHSDAPTTSGGLSFSANSIDLQITGPELPELSMYDLPGSINVAPNEEEQHLVKFIENLIKQFVKDEKALILLVASMDQDLETSTAFRFVRDSKALGRSMGVLTKPDLLRGRFDHVKRILKGEVFKLGCSWYVTKNLSQEELDSATDYATARYLEKRFFAENAPWSTQLLDYEGRFGTANVQNAISHLLVAHIENELPGIIARVGGRLDDVSAQLDAMPERPTQPSQTVIAEIQKLVNAVVLYLQGNDDGAKFRTAFKALLRQYRGQLQGARPQVVLGTPGYVKPVHSLDSDDDDTMSEATPSKKRKADHGRATPSSTPSNRCSQGASRSKNEQEAAQGAAFTLEQIHRALDQAKFSDMPDQVHPRTVESFIRQSTAPWLGLTSSLLHKVQSTIGQMLVDCITETLGGWQGTELLAKVTEIVQTFSEHVHDDEAKYIDHAVQSEVHKPISYAGGLKQQTEDARAKLQAGRLAERIDEHFDTLEAANNVRVPTGEKRKDKTKDLDFVTRALGPDKYTSEVSAMASPLAYYDLAAGRLLDTVANHLEYGIVHAVETKLQVRLMLELRVTDAAYCAQLLAEDPAREAERDRLLSERQKLREAVKELEGLKGQY